ncbi:MAG: 50S ribosomal protein L30 [Deltaproteobacteria bacterium]|nr:50S ribosomal protein L30 [Deltaproteobacteria bacterium]MBW2051740.1 50S ribosomal protein L30 [Deltaproteobacteria bacterium]MBW2140279.1 50S ribosomal protein L30 [Deltaproteobacteria bacterium]MBW2322122.1 50S ribosomal protein L30 [Deltaproteobacteria bacterium]
MAKELKITQIRSLIGRIPKHRRTVRALGLTKINKTVIHKDSPEIRGMIKQVSHLVRVEEKS